jgi:hypothetical protein
VDAVIDEAAHNAQAALVGELDSPRAAVAALSTFRKDVSCIAVPMRRGSSPARSPFASATAAASVGARKE